MIHQFDIRVSQRDADLALRRFLFRKTGWVSLVASLWCLCYIILDLSNGGLGYLGVAMLTLLLLFLLLYAIAYFVRRKQMAELLQRLGDTPVSYELDEMGLSAESALGNSALRWEMIKSLWIDADVILIFYSRNGYTTIPTPQIPEKALEFLVCQVREGDGKIIDRRKD